MAETKDKRKWVWAVRLQLLSHAADDPALLRVLGSAVRRSMGRVQDASGSQREDYEDVAELESENIEDLLGMSFIACQISINRVLARCRLLHKSGELGPEPRKSDLMQRCCQIITGTRCSQVTAINEFANCFKHADEWPPHWGRSGPHLATAEAIRAMGGKPSSTGNMRRGFATILGHDDYGRVRGLGEVITEWTKRIRREYERKLEDLKLLPGAR